VERRRFGASEPTVKIDGKSYVLAQQSGRPVFASGTRVIEGAPSDDFELKYDDWSMGLGSRMPTSIQCLTTVRNRLYPRPTIKSLTISANDDFRWSFEEQDGANNWYLYLISPKRIVKIELLAAPLVREIIDLAGAPFVVGDIFGQPVKMRSTRMAGLRWMVPGGNGNRFFVLDTVADFPATDVWTAITAVVDGATHFVQLPSGRIMRSTAVAGALEAADISILPAGADAETDANWGANFAVDSPNSRIRSLMAFDELVVIGKNNGYFTAIENTDGTISYRSLLTETSFNENNPTAGFGGDSFVGGTVWHSRMYLPTPYGPWRHNVYSALPVGTDVSDYAPEDEPAFFLNTPRYGVQPSFAHGGKWLYAPYNRDDTSGSLNDVWLLAARDRQSDDDIERELTWSAIDRFRPTSVLGRCQLFHIQRNGPSAPRLFMLVKGEPSGAETSLRYMLLGPDAGPVRRNGGEWGEVSDGGNNEVWNKEEVFPSNALLREVRLLVGRTATGMTWHVRCQRDSNAVESVGGGGLSNTGSLFWTPGTADTARRLYMAVGWHTDGTYAVAQNQAPHLREMRVYGTYLPDVSDDLQFVIDVGGTAKRRRVSEKSVRDALRALRNAGAKAWVDPYGTGGQVLVSATSDQAPKKMAALEMMEVVTVRGTLLEYS